MADTDGQKRKRLPAAERRKRIIAAARSAFMEQGFSGTRTREIAERAGVTEAFLYRHFASKNEMYEAAVLEPLREGVETLAADVERLHGEIVDPVAFIHALNKRCLEFYADFAGLQTVALYSELSNGREVYLRSLRPKLDRIGELIGDRVGWTAQGLDPTIVRRAVLGSQWGIGFDFTRQHRKMDLETVTDRLTEMFTGGIKDKPSSGPRQLDDGEQMSK